MVQVTEQARLDPAELGLSGGLDLDLHPDLDRRGPRRGRTRLGFRHGLLGRIWGALPVMAALWVSVLGATITHWQVDWVAGLAFLPYLVWVTIAAFLNLSVARLNPGVPPLRPAEL